MKGKFCVFMSLSLAMCLIVGALAIREPQKASAYAEMYQVNGEYTITNTQLVTKCRLDGDESGLKKKVRTFAITPKTKIQKMSASGSKKTTLKGKARQKMIKKLNKKNLTIQFSFKNGKVLLINII